MTIGMIGLQPSDNNEVQPVVATTTSATESRMLRQSQAQQMRRRRSTYTPPRNVQPWHELVARDNLARDNSVELVFAQSQMTITLPWSFFVSLLMTILLCIHHSYFGSTISPLATARKFATMATSGIPSTVAEGFAV
eukprot:4981613-Amphidinium_carterae.1